MERMTLSSSGNAGGVEQGYAICCDEQGLIYVSSAGKKLYVINSGESKCSISVPLFFLNYIPGLLNFVLNTQQYIRSVAPAH